MKKSTKRLNLHRETIRPLALAPAQAVGGELPPGTTTCGSVTLDGSCGGPFTSINYKNPDTRTFIGCV